MKVWILEELSEGDDHFQVIGVYATQELVEEYIELRHVNDDPELELRFRYTQEEVQYDV